MSCPPGLFEAYSIFGPSQGSHDNFLQAIKSHPNWTPGCETARLFFFSGLPRTPSHDPVVDYDKQPMWRQAISEYSSLLMSLPQFTIYHAGDWIRPFTKGDNRVARAHTFHPASEWLQFLGGSGEFAGHYHDGLVVKKFAAIGTPQRQLEFLNFEVDADRRRWRLADGTEIHEWESDRLLYSLLHVFFRHRQGSLADDILDEVRSATNHGMTTTSNFKWRALIDTIERNLHRI